MYYYHQTAGNALVLYEVGHKRRENLILFGLITQQFHLTYGYGHIFQKAPDPA